jgi:hypothetical protein
MMEDLIHSAWQEASVPSTIGEAKFIMNLVRLPGGICVIIFIYLRCMRVSCAHGTFIYAGKWDRPSMSYGDVCRMHIVIELTGGGDYAQEKMFDIAANSFGLDRLQSTGRMPTKYVLYHALL